MTTAFLKVNMKVQSNPENAISPQSYDANKKSLLLGNLYNWSPHNIDHIAKSITKKLRVTRITPQWCHPTRSLEGEFGEYERPHTAKTVPLNPICAFNQGESTESLIVEMRPSGLMGCRFV